MEVVYGMYRIAVMYVIILEASPERKLKIKKYDRKELLPEEV